MLDKLLPELSSGACDHVQDLERLMKHVAPSLYECGAPRSVLCLFNMMIRFGCKVRAFLVVGACPNQGANAKGLSECAKPRLLTTCELAQ